MSARLADKPSYLWQTLWLIAGPQLPVEEINPRDGIFFAPLDDQSFQRFKKEDTSGPRIEATSDTFVVNYPPRDVVLSRYRLQVDVQHEDQDIATAKATQIVDQLLLSLTLSIPGARYTAELRKVRRSDEIAEYSAWSQIMRVAALDDPGPLSQADLTGVFELYDTIESDETALNAYAHLLTAWQLQDTAGSKPLTRSILQHYILCIEAIVTGVMTDVRKQMSDQIRLKERDFCRTFSEELQRRSNKPEAVRQASTELRNIAMQNMLPSIEQVGLILGISDADVESAKDFYRFRSRKLSHPGRPKGNEMERWLEAGPTVDVVGRADTIARLFLKSYCKHLSSTSKMGA